MNQRRISRPDGVLKATLLRRRRSAWTPGLLLGLLLGLLGWSPAPARTAAGPAALAPRLERAPTPASAVPGVEWQGRLAAYTDYLVVDSVAQVWGWGSNSEVLPHSP